MKINNYIKILLGLIILTASCTNKNEVSKKNITSGDTLKLKHSTYLTITDFPDYTIVNIKNPWDSTKKLQTYILTNGKQEYYKKDLPEGIIVKTPLKRMLLYSAVHCGLFNDFNAIEHIAGICDLQYICEGSIHERVAEGYIMNCGNSMSPDIERIIDLKPDAILLSPYENSSSHSKINKLNIPIIECADYMETSPLGRAEWMRFYGRLVGKADIADSLFNEVEKKYITLKNKTSVLKNKPIVMSELKTGAVWYVPGGRSTTGRLFADAGAKYIFADTKQSGSLALDFEKVLDKGENSDFWFITYNQNRNKTLKQLKADFNGYTQFKAYKNEKVFGCNTAHIPYYEKVPFHPEIILSELVRIIHPEIIQEDNNNIIFFSKLDKE